MVGQNNTKILSKRPYFTCCVGVVSLSRLSLVSRRGNLGLDNRPKTSAVANTTKGTGTRAAVVRTPRRSTQRSVILYSLDAQLYGMEAEHRNKQDNKAYHIGGTRIRASAVRRYSSNRINTRRPFLAEAYLDITLTVIKLLIPF